MYTWYTVIHITHTECLNIVQGIHYYVFMFLTMLRTRILHTNLYFFCEIDWATRKQNKGVVR